MLSVSLFFIGEKQLKTETLTTYKIIEKPPYDKGAPNSFWIRKEVKVFGITISSKTIGDYKMDDTFGELGWMPFFDKKSAKKKLKQLKNHKRSN